MAKKPYIISTFSGEKGELPSARLVGSSSGGGGGGGSVTAADLDNSFKDALLDCFKNVAWATVDGQQYYDALEAALYPLDHITAAYTQSGTVYDTDSLDSLKADLVVTAFYQRGGSKTVTDYTLSGTLTDGTSTITVSYGGETTTFDVVVAHAVDGWYYPFNGSIASRGTHDFGLSGVQEYGDGVNAGEKSYYHHVATEGDASTDPLGLYALASTDAPTWGASDFTISVWMKSVTQNRGWLFAASKCTTTGSTTINWSSATVGNVKSGWAATKANSATKKYAGIRIGMVSEKLYISLHNSDLTKGVQINITQPASFDTTQWHHYALTRSGAVLYYFVDGEMIFKLTIDAADELYSSNSITIGNILKDDTTTPTVTPYPFSNYFQDLYVNVGTAKWTSNFDPTDIVY
jgi:hypothetical protein